jgi:thioredoxin-disulfide reductase
MKVYDTIILGAGPAGLTAAIYAARARLDVLVIGKQTGGYLQEIPIIENCPGYNIISGRQLSLNIEKQVKELGVEILNEEIKEIKKIDKVFEIKTENEKYVSQTVIYCLGSTRKKLNVPGETEFSGKGVTYCFECDAAFFKGKDIAIIGGGNSAVLAVLYMLSYSNKIYMIDIEKEPRAEKIRLEKIRAEGQQKIEIISSHKVNEIKGNSIVKNIEIENINSNEKKLLDVNGVIVEIGQDPNSKLVKQLGVSTDNAFIQVDRDMTTNIPGFFAAGDVTDRELKQIITAEAQGAIAARAVYDYLNS